MFLLISNEAIKVAHLEKLANQLMVNGTLVIEMVAILLLKARKFWSFDEVRNILIKKNERKIWAVKILFSLNFVIYLSYSVVQKKGKVDIV